MNENKDEPFIAPNPEETITSESSFEELSKQPTIEDFLKLERLRSTPFSKKIFEGLQKGSLSSAVILWVRMTMGIGVMTLPYYISYFGVLSGSIALLIGGLFSLMSFSFIFEACDVSGETNYKDLIDQMLPGIISVMFKYSYLYDLCIVLILYSVVGWNLFCYFLGFTGFLKPEWIRDHNKMLLYEYNPEVFTIRAIFFLVIFIFSTPLFLKKTLGRMKNIAYGFLAVMVGFQVYIMAEGPFFRSYYESKNELQVEYLSKTPSPIWITNFFAMVCSYYVQPFILLLRDQVVNPTLKRSRRLATYSVFIEIFIYILFASVCYISFGDKYTTPLMLLRVPYEGKGDISETVFKICFFMFFALNILGLCNYNPGIRDYLFKLFGESKSRTSYALMSLLPFFICCIVGVLVPNIINLFGFNGLVMHNFTGFIIPCFLKLKILEIKMIKGIRVWLIYLLIFFYFTCMFVGSAVKIYDMIK